MKINGTIWVNIRFNTYMKRGNMMKRILLRPNSIVTRVNVCQYMVTEVLGCGATSCVYGVTYKDSLGYEHRAILKECYPVSANIIRGEDNQLVWDTEERKDEYLLQYMKTLQQFVMRI